MNKITLFLLVIIIILIWSISHFIPKTSSCKDLKIFKKILLSDIINRSKIINQSSKLLKIVIL